MSLLNTERLSQMGLSELSKDERRIHQRSLPWLEDTGVLLIDKPAGISSMDVIRVLRRLVRAKKIGHGGTLDPFATGLLPILFNDATRWSDRVMAGVKEYEGSFLLGLQFDTQDMTGKMIGESKEIPLDLDLNRVQQVSKEFVGEQTQIPPIYSAIKKAGRNLYEYARSGEAPEIEGRKVVIESFEVTQWDGHRRCEFHCRVQKGVYVRTLIHDLGQRLGVGAVLESLRRTRVGTFSVDEAVKLPTLKMISDIRDHLKAVHSIHQQ